MDHEYICSDCEPVLEKIKCFKCGRYGSEEDVLINNIIEEPMHVKGDDNSSFWTNSIPIIFFGIVVVAIAICAIIG